jgi:polar amino acid transport system substrate-binding protein
MRSTRLSKLAFAIAAVASALVALPASARPLDEVKASKTLMVIAYLDNAPFSYLDGDTPKGIDVDIANAIAKKLGVKAEVTLRMQAEEADDDLRANIVRGPLSGGGVGDIMMNVPADRDFALRNNEVIIGAPYYQHRVALAIHPEKTGDKPSFQVFQKEKVAVQVATVADYFLMTFEDGSLINNVVHHTKPAVGADEFVKKEVAAFMGVRASVESLLRERGVKPIIVEPPMDGIVRSSWEIGISWGQMSRDLGYAVQAALEKIIKSGEMAKIFKAHGVTYTPPPPPA